MLEWTNSSQGPASDQGVGDEQASEAGCKSIVTVSLCEADKNFCDMEYLPVGWWCLLRLYTCMDGMC